MYLLSPAFLSSANMNLDRMVFWTQYPGSRHGEISMLQQKHVKKIKPSVWVAEKFRSRFIETLLKGPTSGFERPYKLFVLNVQTSLVIKKKKELRK